MSRKCQEKVKEMWMMANKSHQIAKIICVCVYVRVRACGSVRVRGRVGVCGGVCELCFKKQESNMPWMQFGSHVSSCVLVHSRQLPQSTSFSIAGILGSMERRCKTLANLKPRKTCWRNDGDLFAVERAAWRGMARHLHLLTSPAFALRQRPGSNMVQQSQEK
jgi:hypothetical protein